MKLVYLFTKIGKKQKTKINPSIINKTAKKRGKNDK
jgi:hypothetical protein